MLHALSEQLFDLHADHLHIRVHPMTEPPKEHIPSEVPGATLVDAIVRTTPMSILGHTVNVTLAVIAFWGHVAPIALLSWSIASYGVGFWVLLRWLSRRGRAAMSRDPSPLHFNRRALFFGVVLSAPWGVLGFWLLGELPPQSELILIALCVGMSASGSVLLSATYPSAMTYMLCILAPVALKCFFFLGASEYRLLGALTLSYGLFLVNCIASCSKLFVDRNRAVEKLQQSLLETKYANSRFEAALRYMPQGLSMFDGNNQLVAFNQQYLDIYGLSPERVRIGMEFSEVFADQGIVGDLDQYLADFKSRVAASCRTSNTVAFPDGRVIYISYASNSGGGWIATHEDITQRKVAERQIELLAHFDGLTNLANRNLFQQKLHQTLARYRRVGDQFAVILLDLDKFKAVNDTLGHRAGDALLGEVASRIKATIREVDFPARLGGDEFGLLVALGPNDLGGKGLKTLVDRLIQAVGAPYEIDGHSVAIGCSIGIAIVPEHGDQFDEVMQKADLALYKSKKSGRNQGNIYSAELQTEADQRCMLEIELRDAIWRDELEIHYQPIFNLSSGEVTLVEALVRWNHRTRGLIAPAEFIPVAEDSGLIVDLGKWVLRKACKDTLSMPRHVKVSVNLSPAQFARCDLVEMVGSTLAQTGLPGSRLELEITEGVFLDDSAANLKTLERFRELGVSIALDDFGAGYSSLSYLTAFSFDKVKIDRSFIGRFERTETQTVLASIVQLAKSLRLSVVAEGVETEPQLERLSALGVDFGQGYLLGRPVLLEHLNFRSRRGVRHRIVG